MFDSINRILTIITVLIIVLGSGFIAIMVINKKRRRARVSFETTNPGLDRLDSKDYVQIDDVVDGMYVCDGGYRFIAIIKAYGNDFYSAHEGEKLGTFHGYCSFLQTIKTPITYRQYYKLSDLDYTKEKYKKAYDSVVSELYNAVEDFKELQKQVDDLLRSGAVIDERIVKHVRKMKKNIRALEFRKVHLQDQIEYAEILSGEGAVPVREETYVVDWVYNPDDYAYDLSKEEIYQKALVNLRTKTDTMLHALNQGNVYGRRLTTEEMIETYRIHNNPVTGERFKMKHILNSSFFEDIVAGPDPQLELNEKAVEEEIARADIKLMEDLKARIDDIREGVA